MDRWRARCYSCGRSRTSIHPGGPEAWAKEHLELTDGEHDVRLRFHADDPASLPPAAAREERYPFPEADFPEEPVLHRPY